MKKFVSIIFVVLILALMCSCGAKSENNKDVNKNIEGSEKTKIPIVGIIQYDDNDLNVEIRKGIVQGLRECGFKEGTNIIFKNQQAKSNVSYIKQINNKFVEDGCDVIIPIGSECTLNSIEVCKDTDIKIVYAAVSDPKGFSLCDKSLNPIVSATGTIDKYNINKNLKLIKNLLKDINTLGVIYAKNSLASKNVIDEYKYYGAQNEIEIISIGINSVDDMSLAYDSLEKKVDAIVIINDDVVINKLDYIINKSKEIKKPIFSQDKNIVKKGAIACYSIDLLELGKETGKMVANVLNGANIQNERVKNIENDKLYVNKTSLQHYGFSLDNELLEGANVYE